MTTKTNLKKAPKVVTPSEKVANDQDEASRELEEDFKKRLEQTPGATYSASSQRTTYLSAQERAVKLKISDIELL